MSIGAFADKRHPPTGEEILAVLGFRRSLWDQLAVYIKKQHRAQDDLKFYSKDLGWAVRFSKESKALLSLYPAEESITAQIVLGPSLMAEAVAPPLGEGTRRLLEAAHEYPEGRWLFLKIESDEDLRDIQRLLDIKARPAR